MKEIGWRRLLMSPAQKYVHDISTLGQKQGRKERFICWLDSFLHAPLRTVFNWKMRRALRQSVYNVYWLAGPTRKRVCERGTAIYEYKPWFGNHTIQWWGGDKLMRIGGKPDPSEGRIYSWKKAYYKMQANAKEERRYQVERDLNRRLKHKGEGSQDG